MQTLIDLLTCLIVMALLALGGIVYGGTAVAPELFVGGGLF